MGPFISDRDGVMHTQEFRFGPLKKVILTQSIKHIDVPIVKDIIRMDLY